ncbi:unnamed protein product [Fraxinus pennsylvanica]|uniref:Uncharacterized protein n=1 Tax=Fraxinus pennsylvanica TaxID=56036 RepID=A0AAD1YRZ6_9LAMI|nr:unnamed protein product [Fraxinus pennsylvanica]
MDAAREVEGFLDKIKPPRLEDAGLEDCALPPESIKEAFLKAANAVRSIISAPDDEDEGEGRCVDDPIEGSSDILVGIKEGVKSPPGSCAAEKGGGLTEAAGDDVLVAGGGAEDKPGDLLGSSVPEDREAACVDGLQGLEIGGKGRGILDKKMKNEKGEDEEKKPILAEAKRGHTLPSYLACMITGAAGAAVYYNLKLRHHWTVTVLLIVLLIGDVNLHFSVALSGMITGAAGAAVYYNLKLRHHWTVTVLLIVLFIGDVNLHFSVALSVQFENIFSLCLILGMQEASRCLASDYNGGEKVQYKLVRGGQTNGTGVLLNDDKASEVWLLTMPTGRNSPVYSLLSGP